MHTGITPFFRSPLSAFVNLIQPLKKKNIQQLDQHILSIYSRKTIEGLVAETALCLKTVIRYKLFAFAIEENEGLKVWSDPLLSKARLLELLEKDFPSTAIDTLSYITQGSDNIITTFFHKPDKVQTFAFSDTGRKARLYLVHGRTSHEGHEKAARIMIQAFEHALSTILKIRDLEKAAASDPLTGCYNRQTLTDLLDNSITNAHRYTRDLSLIMMDIDHFKSINDTFGHLFGDHVLKSLAAEIQGFIRKGDALARYGGEEFALVLPETPFDMALDIAQRLKSKIAAFSFETPDGKPLHVTASFGVASVTKNDDSQELLSRADDMLYRAKDHGRNCVMPLSGRMRLKKTV